MVRVNECMSHSFQSVMPDTAHRRARCEAFEAECACVADPRTDKESGSIAIESSSVYSRTLTATGSSASPPASGPTRMASGCSSFSKTTVRLKSLVKGVVVLSSNSSRPFKNAKKIVTPSSLLLSNLGEKRLGTGGSPLSD